MMLPFTVEQFIDVFRRYNDAIWPAQWALLAAGLIAVGLALAQSRAAGRAVSAILAALWIWSGAVYHIAFFSEVNSAAPVFGLLFTAQGLLFLWIGVWKGRLAFAAGLGPRRVIGGAIMLYALLAYPLFGYLLGHRFPAAPTFGVPCPLTIFTLGLLAWATPIPRIALVVPVAWALMGVLAALKLGMLEDLGLPVATLLAVGVTFGSGRARANRRDKAIIGPVKEAT